ncbi:MAG: SDR family oxidoreductase [Acidobacteriota bacterium]|nr:MAG: SDR family oxidoreductase [Acidobacteriota bacterium]
MGSTSVALVTGAARGIGRAIADRLLGDGHAVALLDLDDSALQHAASQLSARGPTLALHCDVGGAEAVRTALSEIRTRLGEIGVLINNAGIGGPFHRIDEVSDEEWERVFRTNVKGVFLLCRELLPRMRQRRFGRIVNIASIQGLRGAARSTTYVASKHAVVGYTRALAVEWGAHGVTCNAVCPGYIDTAMGVQEDAIPGHAEQIRARTPAGRIGTATEVAALVSYLVGAEGSYVNGACFVIDGGITAGM